MIIPHGFSPLPSATFLPLTPDCSALKCRGMKETPFDDNSDPDPRHRDNGHHWLPHTQGQDPYTHLYVPQSVDHCVRILDALQSPDRWGECSSADHGSNRKDRRSDVLDLRVNCNGHKNHRHALVDVPLDPDAAWAGHRSPLPTHLRFILDRPLHRHVPALDRWSRWIHAL